MLIENIQIIKGVYLNENRKLLTSSDTYNYVITFNGTSHLENNGHYIHLYLQDEMNGIVIDNHSYYLFFNKELIKDKLELQFLEQRGSGLSIHLSYMESSHFAHLAEVLISNFFHEGQELSLLFVRNIIEQIILLYMLKVQSSTEIEFGFTSDRTKKLAHNFLSLVKKHLRKHKKLCFYSNKLKVTDKALTKSTKEVFNCTPKELIQREITREAREMLFYSDLSIKEIAYQIGFEEVNNFSTFFKKHTDRTPSAYRDDPFQGTA